MKNTKMTIGARLVEKWLTPEGLRATVENQV